VSDSLKTARWVIAAALLLVTAAPVAGADQVGHADKKEYAAFNISLISHGHGHLRADGSAWLQHSVRMHRRWRSKRVRRYGGIGVVFPSRNRRIEILYRRELRARMTKDSGRMVGRPQVWRSDRRTITVSFPARWLGRAVQHYNWHALALFSLPCDDVVNAACAARLDRAPNKGNVRHRL
jgi:hypothetical protein